MLMNVSVEQLVNLLDTAGHGPASAELGISEQLTPLHLTVEDHQRRLKPIGLFTQQKLCELKEFTETVGRPTWQFIPASNNGDPSGPCVAFVPEVIAGGRAAVTGLFAELINHWRGKNIFPGLLGKLILVRLPGRPC
jgi:hypothetical protein